MRRMLTWGYSLTQQRQVAKLIDLLDSKFALQEAQRFWAFRYKRVFIMKEDKRF
tara:strand:+ start:338 stop:499 length:162 start_codon:yes stop_codon:yes gene_type:complete